MIKTILINIEDLESMLNNKKFKFLCNYGEQFIFIYNDSPKSTELMKNKTLLDLIGTLDINDFKEFGDEIHLKQVMKDFYIYWTAKNEGGKKERRQMEKVFDVKQRYYTFLRRAKPKEAEKPNNIIISNEI